MFEYGHDTRPTSVLQRMLSQLVSMHLFRECRNNRTCPLLGILFLSVFCAVALPVVNATVIYPAYTKIIVGTFEDTARRLAQHLIPHSVDSALLLEDRLRPAAFQAEAFQLGQDTGLLELKIFGAVPDN